MEGIKLNMERNKNLNVGFDLGNENSQISCFHPKTGEIETIGGNATENYYFIPTVLGVSEGRKEWSYGENALRMAEHEDGILIDNIVNRITLNEEFLIYGVTFTKEAILEKFFRKTLVLLRKYYTEDVISKIVITIKDMEPVLVETIYKALEGMGIGKDRAFVQPYQQSYVYYALNQKKELWNKDIALFDFSKQGLTYYRLYLNRSSIPMIVGIEKKEYNQRFSWEMYKYMNAAKFTESFYEVAKEALYKQDISTLYFVGEGFLSNWLDGALQKLCVGRRGFRGPNIYTRGACYSARLLETQEFSRNFLLLSEDALEHEILLRLYKDGSIIEYDLISAGTIWNSAKAELDVIFDEEEELQIIIKNVIKQESRIKIITLEGMPKRPNRMGRYTLDFSFEDIKTCVVKIRDKGFGSFVPSSGRIWEKRIEI